MPIQCHRLIIFVNVHIERQMSTCFKRILGCLYSFISNIFINTNRFNTMRPRQYNPPTTRLITHPSTFPFNHPSIHPSNHFTNHPSTQYNSYPSKHPSFQPPVCQLKHTLNQSPAHTSIHPTFIPPIHWVMITLCELFGQCFYCLKFSCRTTAAVAPFATSCEAGSQCKAGRYWPKDGWIFRGRRR